jgi:hypothetical protein
MINLALLSSNLYSQDAKTQTQALVSMEEVTIHITHLLPSLIR